jgi:hypothetical protein
VEQHLKVRGRRDRLSNVNGLDLLNAFDQTQQSYNMEQLGCMESGKVQCIQDKLERVLYYVRVQLRVKSKLT